jgi:hypothetical protein
MVAAANTRQHSWDRYFQRLCQPLAGPDWAKLRLWPRATPMHRARGQKVKDGCEDCGLKRATCGVPGDTKKARWCVPCSRQHEGARHQRTDLCEDCGLKRATCGVLGDTKKRRWCGPCSRQHGGARHQRTDLCEDCGLKQARRGVPGDAKKRRWCGPCSRQHGGTRHKITMQPPPAVKSEVGVKVEVDGALAIEQLSTLSRASNRPTVHCELPMRGSFRWQSTASAHAAPQYNSCTLPSPRLNMWRQYQGQFPVGVPLQRRPPSCVPWMGGAWVRAGWRGAKS